jgi:hypothetical protein
MLSWWRQVEAVVGRRFVAKFTLQAILFPSNS